MNTFKKLLLLLLMSLLFTAPVYATEVPSVEVEENISPLISGMDATVRWCEKVNIREQPTTSSKVLATIKHGEHVTIVDQTGSWFKIKYGDISGFIFWKYIGFTEPEVYKDSNLIGNSIIHYKSSENRDTNISIACSTINGIIIQPQEEFIWSEVIGQTTKEKGYATATVILNGKATPGLGGGVCQVSTTIYNATFDTKYIEVLKVTSHSKSVPCAYAKKDATVAHGFIDFVFKNTSDYPIKIETYSYKSVVFVNFYKLENKSLYK